MTRLNEEAVMLASLIRQGVSIRGLAELLNGGVGSSVGIVGR
jgi:hypothetical protein